MTTLQYFRSLTMALRQRKLSDDKVADVLRELQSHLQETGRSPEEAFGSPNEYAARFPAGNTIARGTKAGYIAIAMILAVMTVKIFTGQVLDLSLGFPGTLIYLGATILLAVVLLWRSIALLLKLPEGFTYEPTGQR